MIGRDSSIRVAADRFLEEEIVTASVVGLSGSPKPVSRSRALLELTLAALERQGAGPSRLIDLAALPADALLGRREDRDVTEAIQTVLDSGIVVVSTPIYRATYSGLLKVFFDLLPQDALARKVAIAIATGGGPGHLLAVDHGLRPLSTARTHSSATAPLSPHWSSRSNGPPSKQRRLPRECRHDRDLLRAPAL